MLFSYLCLGPRSSQISVRRLGSKTNWWWLFQGLHSKDKKILQSVLMRNDPVLISNTVARLSLQCTLPLIKELATLIQGKTVVWVDFSPCLHLSYWWSDTNVGVTPLLTSAVIYFQCGVGLAFSHLVYPVNSYHSHYRDRQHFKQQK